MTVSFKLVRDTFRSRVTLDRPKLQILVEYLQGPFSHMQNRWSFRALDDRSCEVEFFIDYEFRSRTLGMLMGGMFDMAFAASPRPSRRAPAKLRAQNRLVTNSESMASASSTDSRRTSARPMSPNRRSR